MADEPQATPENPLTAAARKALDGVKVENDQPLSDDKKAEYLQHVEGGLAHFKNKHPSVTVSEKAVAAVASRYAKAQSEKESGKDTKVEFSYIYDELVKETGVGKPAATPPASSTDTPAENDPANSKKAKFLAKSKEHAVGIAVGGGIVTALGVMLGMSARNQQQAPDAESTDRGQGWWSWVLGAAGVSAAAWGVYNMVKNGKAEGLAK